MRIVILVVGLWFATSPLYAKIVLSSYRDDAGYEIFTMDTDGGEPIQITNNRHDSFSPTWSPDGRQIAFNRDSHIYVIDADGENLRQLTRQKNNEQDLHPDWSPDGKLIAFDRFTGGAPNRRANIYTVDPVTRFVKKVTDFGFNAQSPKWSPDGQWILFEGPGDLYAIRPDGSDKRIVSQHHPGEPKWLGGWAPEGKRIVYLEWGEDERRDRILVATLDMDLLNVVTEEVVPIPLKVTINAVGFGREVFIPPKVTINAVTFGADGQSILFVGDNSSFRLRLDTNELIQLTGAPFSDYSLQEWRRGLSVAPKQEMFPQTWGRIKAKPLAQ